MRFAHEFHSRLHHSWKSLAKRLNRDPKIVIHDNSCIILYIIVMLYGISCFVGPLCDGTQLYDSKCQLSLTPSLPIIHHAITDTHLLAKRCNQTFPKHRIVIFALTFHISFKLLFTNREIVDGNGINFHIPHLFWWMFWNVNTLKPKQNCYHFANIFRDFSN